MAYCHEWKPIPNGGVNLCTRPLGHRTNHLDEIHNVSWNPDHPDSRPRRGPGLPVSDPSRLASMSRHPSVVGRRSDLNIKSMNDEVR